MVFGTGDLICFSVY